MNTPSSHFSGRTPPLSALLLILAVGAPLTLTPTTHARLMLQDGAAASPAQAAVQASSAAIREANTLSFTLSMQAEGASIAQYTPTLTADVRMMRDPANRSIWLVRASGAGKLTPTDTETRFDVAWTANAVEWLDHTEKKFYRRPGGAAKGKIMQLAGAARVREFVEASPLSKILKSASFEESGRETIDGADCIIIDGMAKRAGTKERIVIAPDNIPRRIEMILESDMLAGRVTANYRSMRVNEAMQPEDLRITPPEGYESDIVEPSTTPAPTPAKPEAGGTPVETAPTPPPAPIVKGPESAPDLQLPVGETPLSLASLKGNVVILDFFGTWSLAARPAHAELKDLLTRYKDKPVKIYSLAIREKTPEAATAYFSKQGLDWGTQGGLIGVGDPFVAPMKVKAYPTYCIINKDGMVIARITNFRRTNTMAYVAACIDAALEGKDAPPEPTETPIQAAVPEIKVTAPDGSTVSATGSINAPAGAAKPDPNPLPAPTTKPGPGSATTPLDRTKVGTPTNTVTPRTAPDSGTKKEQPKK
ncbi:MAG: redoxin domain-containing protein [Planctomycetes bacterium]|nr:redoxin domain-containing protein [Planctomycetota bacterium]